jgi:hypothetical protein
LVPAEGAIIFFVFAFILSAIPVLFASQQSRASRELEPYRF